MTGLDNTATAVATTTMPGAAGRAVTRLAIRQSRHGALVVTVLAAGMTALVAATYRSTVETGQDVAALSALAGNPAIRTLFGEPTALDQAGGFTVWRTGTALAVLLGIWGLLTATRTTRGEEDAGHWDLLLAGRLPLRGVVIRQLVVLVAAMGLAGTAVSVALIAAGTNAGSALLHGYGLALVAICCIAAGGLAAQIFPARAQASSAAIALLGIGLLLRMIGDGVHALAWVRWLTPFGLMELTRPYDGDRWQPLLVLAATAATGLLAAMVVTARRDLRGGWLAPATGRAPRLRLLGSVRAFAVRRMLPPLAGWSAGITAYFLLIGLIAASMTRFLADNPRFADLAGQAGFPGLGTVEGYAATLFALLAIPAGVFVAGRIAAGAEAETGRRLTLLFAGPVTRNAVAHAEIAAAAGGAVVLVIVAGLATWTGTTIAGARLGVGAALAGVFNVLPIAALCLGAAVFALGVVPSAVAWVGSLPAWGGFLLKIIVDSTGAPAWIGELSPYAHLALVPAETPDRPGAIGMLAIAGALCAAGLRAYQRRDLRG